MRWVFLLALVLSSVAPGCNHRLRECDETCSTSDECASGTCATWLQPARCRCESNPSCHLDAECGPAAFCFQGLCVLNNCHECTSDAQCLPAATCQSTGGGCTRCIALPTDMTPAVDLWFPPDG